jgi:hypothetical protein
VTETEPDSKAAQELIELKNWILAQLQVCTPSTSQDLMAVSNGKTLNIVSSPRGKNSKAPWAYAVAESAIKQASRQAKLNVTLHVPHHI